jgi:hypothetical protein
MTTLTPIKRLLAAAFVALAGIGTCQAAERIRYNEIPDKLGGFGTVLVYRGFKVTTLDGKEHSGRRLRLEADHLRVFYRNNTWEDLPAEQVSKIKISQAGRYFHHIAESAEIPLALAALLCGGPWEGTTLPFVCMAPITALFSPAWAYTAVTGPFYLASDGVAFLIPPKTYEIIH